MSRRRKTSWIAVAAIACLVAGASAGWAQENEEEEIIHGTATPCVLGGLISPPMEGWFTVEVEDPPPGKLGCVLFRPVDEIVHGIMRLKSVDETLEKYQGDPYGQLWDDSQVELASMALELGPVIHKNENVPTGAVVTEGLMYVQEGMLPNNPIRQSVWTVIFRAPGYFYVANLITADEEAGQGLFETNRAAFLKLLSSFQPKDDSS